MIGNQSTEMFAHRLFMSGYKRVKMLQLIIIHEYVQ